MKRSCINLNKEKEAIPLPLDILGEIAKQYEPRSMRDIYQFMSISKSTQLVLHHCILTWLEYIMKENERNYYYRLLQSFIYAQKFNMRVFSIIWFNEKASGEVDIIGFLYLFLQLIQEALWEKRLFMDYYRQVCGKYDKNPSMKLSQLFYFDSEKKRVIPMKKYPDLRMMNFPRKTNMRESLSKLVSENYKSPIKELALLGIKSQNTGQMKHHYHEIQKSLSSSKKTGKPHKSSFISNALIKNESLFSPLESMEFIRNKIYYCTTKDTTTEEREKIVFMYIHVKDRMESIFSGMDFYVRKHFRSIFPQFK